MAQYDPGQEVGMGYGSLAPGAANAPLRFNGNDFGFQAPVQPIMNMHDESPAAHPLEAVARLVHDHTNIVRQRLMAAHLQQGLAPEQVSEHGGVRDPLQMIQQTRSPSFSNLAALMAKFAQANRRAPHDPGFQTDAGGSFARPSQYTPSIREF